MVGRILDWLIGFSPVAALVLMILGGVFVIAELFFSAKGEQPGEAQWKALQTGYFAPFISYTIGYFKRKITGK